MLAGDPNIGKTAFAYCWKNGAPLDPHGYVPAFYENYKKKVRVGDQKVWLQIWDTAGQEEMENIRTMSYTNTDVFLLLFSYEDVNSLESIRSKWVPEISESVGKGPALVLVGVRGNVRENYQEHEARGESPVKDEMIQEVMREIGADCFVDCCPQINSSVQEAMARALAIGLEMKQQRLEGEKGSGKKHDDTPKSSKCNVA